MKFQCQYYSPPPGKKSLLCRAIKNTHMNSLNVGLEWSKIYKGFILLTTPTLGLRSNCYVLLVVPFLTYLALSITT